MKLTVNDNNMVVLDKGRLELFVDQRYMGGKMGKLSGSTLTTLGLLPYRLYKSIDDKTPCETGRYNTLNIPSLVEFHPTKLDMDVTVKLYPDSEDKKYTIMTFDAGTGMWSQYGVQALENSQMFVDAILGGQLDTNIPYTMLVPAWLKNLKLNGQNAGVPVAIMEIIIHAMCRDKRTGKPFGEVIGKDPSHSLIGYNFMNVREASAASIFGALSFEDQNSMLDVAINMTTQNKEQRISPLEKVIKY